MCLAELPLSLPAAFRGELAGLVAAGGCQLRLVVVVDMVRRGTTVRTTTAARFMLRGFEARFMAMNCA